MAAVEIGDSVIDSSIQGSLTRLCLPRRPPEADSQRDEAGGFRQVPVPNNNGGNARIWQDGDVNQDGNRKLRRPPHFVLALELFHTCFCSLSHMLVEELYRKMNAWFMRSELDGRMELSDDATMPGADGTVS